jgi:6-phosphofructokinase 1
VKHVAVLTSGGDAPGMNAAIRVAVAEDAHYNAEGLTRFFRENGGRLDFDLRATTLEHVQRGGAPGAFDRLLATGPGAAATEALSKGEHGVLVGLVRGEVRSTPLEEVVAKKKFLDSSLLELAQVLAR